MQTTKRLGKQRDSRRGGLFFWIAATALTIVAARYFSPNAFQRLGPFGPNGTGEIFGTLVPLETPVFGDATARLSDDVRNAQDDFFAKSDDDSPARRLLGASIARLEELRSLSAEFDFESNFFGERYFGRGRYEEASVSLKSDRSERRLPLEQTRFRLSATTGKTTPKEALEQTEENALEVVCDAGRQSLWTYWSVEGTKTLSQINMEELSNALSRLDEDEQKTLRESGVDQPCGSNGLPGLGGLSGTLKRLGSVYRFNPEIQRGADSINGISVVKIVGTMKDDVLQKLTRSLGVDVLEPYLAENIPTGVEIYFGEDWPFPFKIQYFSISNDEKKIRNDIFRVEYSAVARNDASVRPENFNYNQPQITFERETARYLERLIPGIRL